MFLFLPTTGKKLLLQGVHLTLQHIPLSLRHPPRRHSKYFVSLRKKSSCSLVTLLGVLVLVLVLVLLHPMGHVRVHGGFLWTQAGCAADFAWLSGCALAAARGATPR